MAQALGFTLTEEMRFDQDGHQLNPDFITYHIPRAQEMPVMDVIFVQTDEPSGPFGAKSVAEISTDGVAPAVASAVHDATGVWLRTLPYTSERVRHILDCGGVNAQRSIFEIQAELCRCMSNPTRIEIVHVLRDGPQQAERDCTPHWTSAGDNFRHSACCAMAVLSLRPPCAGYRLPDCQSKDYQYL